MYRPSRRTISPLFVCVNVCRFSPLFHIHRSLTTTGIHSLSKTAEKEIERIVRTINDHPYPDQPLLPVLENQVQQSVISAAFVEQVLGKLFASHSNGLKAYEFFKCCLKHELYVPSSDAFEKTLHILARMRHFEKAWELMERIKQVHPLLLTLKSMSIMLSRIAKFQSYEDTIEAFDRMQGKIFTDKKFGTDEFNVLLRAFCTQRQMKEARSVFNKMYSQFLPNTKTMNILLLGFKESGDVTAVELFYHEMIRRGFKPNNVTYNIRIDAACKRGNFGDALRLYEAMESANCAPTLETITTLIHGAGLVGNTTKAKQFFDEISERSLQPDIGAYNALLSSIIRSKDFPASTALMEEMERRNIDPDNVTYHTMFWGLIRSRRADGVSLLYAKMVENNFVPKARTVVMLMKFFCENGMVDVGLDLWNFLSGKGQCPHSHALDILATGLCARGRVEEALECCKETLGKGRSVSEGVVQMLERILLEMKEEEKLEELQQLNSKLNK
ncbi:pentatricopeptide repeat-containing protein At3g61360 isoform X2 [Andrographis paniculata]|uniref:pentatricopeptide repeat-containing protein At3g61360 isoform X2 n=1 Tax=Andrographis paniculata TaxID=175694 RepID=UPI0021E7DBCC|nr:pentatricopeptide repeat-containing protein At3g61360 isoform X2 [Andrographis paniculata]XP_051119356.1 pentatricopeptide repeat-containing protein At3g61360 isoform X2 [Andrographis paniculata]